MQFAGSHLLTSLLSFNIGVELGQLLVLVLLIPVLELLFRFVVAERMGTIILSALVAHTGWHWMLERARSAEPVSRAVAGMECRIRRLASVMRWLMLASCSWREWLGGRWVGQARPDKIPDERERAQ